MTAKIIPENNTILFTGSRTLKQIEDLIKQFDLKGAGGIKPQEQQMISQIAQGMREAVLHLLFTNPVRKWRATHRNFPGF